MIETVTPFLVEQGLLGVAILALGYWGWSRARKVDELQAARVEDVRATIEMAERTRATNEKLANAVAALTDEIRRNGGR